MSAAVTAPSLATSIRSSLTSSESIDKINTLSDIAKEESEIIDEYVKIIQEKITESNKIKTKKFLKQSLPVQKRLIYNLFIKYNLDYDRTKILNILEFIHNNSDSKSGKTCSLTENLWIFVSYESIETITNNDFKPPSIRITKEGKYNTSEYTFEIEKFEKEVRKFPKDNEGIAYVNLPYPIDFELRTRQEGDIIQPLGMKGTQKLKKYLNEKKIPNHEKDKLLFLAQGNEILWAINSGISDKIKVSSKPSHRLTFYKKEQT